jgi:hypothetical protein
MRLTRGGYEAAVAAGLTLFVFATNRFSGAHAWGGDVINYERMAEAAPGLPDGGPIGSVFTDRFSLHYLTGLAADLTGLSVRTTYRVGALAFVLLAIAAAALVLHSLGVRRWVYTVGLSAFVLGAYSDIRDVLQAPGALQDIAFVLGAAIVLLGLIRADVRIVLPGAVLGVVARQSMLLVALAAAAWILLDPAWRDRRRALAAAAVVLLTGAAYGLIKLATDSFSRPFAPDSLGETVLAAPGTPRELAAHLARCAIAVAVPAALLVATLVILRLRELPVRLWLCLLMFGALAVQPVLISPDYPTFAHNEQRLAGFALLPLAAALAIALEEAAARGAIGTPKRWMEAAFVGLLALASLHHVTTWLGPASLAQFLALQVIAAAGLVAGLALLVRYGRMTRSNATRPPSTSYSP